MRRVGIVALALFLNACVANTPVASERPASTATPATPATPDSTVSPSAFEGYVDPPVWGGWLNGWAVDKFAPRGPGIDSVRLYLDGPAGPLLGAAANEAAAATSRAALRYRRFISPPVTVGVRRLVEGRARMWRRLTECGS